MTIDELCEKYWHEVYGMALRFTRGNESDAQDLTQDTFVVAKEQFAKLTTPEKPMLWLLAILRLKGKEHRRAWAKRATLEIPAKQQKRDDQEWIDKEELTASMGEYFDGAVGEWIKRGIEADWQP